MNGFDDVEDPFGDRGSCVDDAFGRVDEDGSDSDVVVGDGRENRTR